MLTLGEVAEATAGRLVGRPDTDLASVSTDSRAIEAGALFVALRGDRFDGHEFCRAALEGGAGALVVDDGEALPEGGAGVVVKDTLEALQRLAAWHRSRQPTFVAALTGSAGKTTTKELTAAILGQRYRTLATAGNLNNHIGVPLTLLRLRAEHERAVVEMGCNGFGEIALLAGLAVPDAGLVTNVGEAHLEGLGDLDGVARAKGELLAALGPSGTAVVNVDDPRVRAMRTRARRLGFGRSGEAEVRVVESRLDGASGRQAVTLDVAGERVEAQLGLLGELNVMNAVAAAALASAAGATAADIEAGLAAVEAPPGRLRPVKGRMGLRVLDDSYNANPRSMEAALEVLVGAAGGRRRAYAVLGEMAELGAAREAGHERVGRRAAELGVTTLVVVGEGAEALRRGALAAGMPRERALAAATPEDAAALVLSAALAGDVVLVKGSRVARMERAVAALGEEAL